MSNPFSSVWAALSRVAASLNRFADNFDRMSEQMEGRTGPAELPPPKRVEAVEVEPTVNGRARKVAAR